MVEIADAEAAALQGEARELWERRSVIDEASWQKLAADVNTWARRRLLPEPCDRVAKMVAECESSYQFPEDCNSAMRELATGLERTRRWMTRAHVIVPPSWDEAGVEPP